MKFAHLTQAYPVRLDRIEEGCIAALTDEGCWAKGGLAVRYWSLRRDALEEKHKARAARKMRVVHAWECLCLVRELKAMLRRNGKDALKVAIVAGALESKVDDVMTGEKVARGNGSRREEGESEQNKLSALLYLFAKRAYLTRSFGGMSAAAIYMIAIADAPAGEVYDPSKAASPDDALRQQAVRWRKWGLL